MPNVPIKLNPGINTQATALLNEGGWSDSNLTRFVDGQPQKLGGWEDYLGFSVGSAVRRLKAWRDINATDHLAVGAASTLGVVTSGVLADITPQTLDSDIAPDIETTSASTTVTITDPNVSNVTTYDTVFFQTPVTVGGLLLVGAYPITLVTGSTTYEITTAAAASATVATIAITGATQANPCVISATSHGRSNGDLVYIDDVVGMTELNGNIYEVANANANDFELDGIDSSAYTAYSSGGNVYGGIVPQFTTSSGSSIVTVTIVGHGMSVGNQVTFPGSTSVGGVAVSGSYTVLSVTSVDAFTISTSTAAASAATVSMNSGEAALTYYIALGPAPAGAGYGIGTYGTGGYGTGVVPTAQTGAGVAPDDWSLDNWSQTLVACPRNGGLYVWDPDGGFETARLISGSDAPIYNTGCFISQPANILVAYGSTTLSTSASIGVSQDPLLVRWSDQDNYEDWSIDTTDQVGSVRLPRGSRIVGGIQGPNQGLLWTDTSIWSMQYTGQPLVFAFNEIASGCGLIAKHAQAVLKSVVYWMEDGDFFRLSGNGVQSIPCTVWDAVFQDLDKTAVDKCWAWANSVFDEVWFFYPSLQDGTGECSRYAKLHTPTGFWDKGIMARSAGIDNGVLGYPLAGTSTGTIYQHEKTMDADGQAMNAYVESGEVLLSEGDACMFIDQILPDMRYGFYGDSEDANLAVTVTATNDLNGETMSSGPLAYTASTKYLGLRVRGHRVKVRIESSDTGSWWRVGRMRVRTAPDGSV